MFHHHYLPSSWIFFFIQFGRNHNRNEYTFIYSCFFSDEIAFCMEKSYRKVSSSEATRMLYLNKPDELGQIAQKVHMKKLVVKLV